MTSSVRSEGWNPKWMAFLAEIGLTTQQADEMGRAERISLNASFMCWNVSNMTIERKRHFFG